MKNTAKRSVVDWEIDFSTDVKVSREVVDVNTVGAVKDILTAVGCLYTLNDNIDLSAFDVDVPQSVLMGGYAGYKAFLLTIYKWIPDSKEVINPSNILEVNPEFEIKDTRQISGYIKLVKAGASDDYTGTTNEHHETTTRSSFNGKKLSVLKYTTHCPGVKVLVRGCEERDFAWLYNFTVLVKNEDVGHTLWICQLSIYKNNFMTADSFCKIVPMIEPNDDFEEGIKN